MTLARFRTPAAGVLSGLLFSLAFPPREWTLLLPLGLVPWLVALARETSRARALVSGIFFGIAFWCASIPWVIYVVTRFGGQSLPLGIASLILVALILCQWPAVVAWGTVAFAAPESGRRLAVFPVLWLASEHARSYVYGGFPWNLTGFALYRHPIWLQSASVWGVYGVGFLVTSAASLIAFAVLRRRARWLLAPAALALFTGLAGVFAMRAPQAPSEKVLEVALIQPNISQEARLQDGRDAQNYHEVISLARKAAAQGADLIVLPESAFPVYWQGSPLLRRDLTSLAQTCGCPVLFNDVDLEPDGRHYNAARIVTPEGLVDSTYRKVHLVPFGEFVPLPEIFFYVRQVSTEIGEFSAAREPLLLSAPPLHVGVGVCYEILYPVLAWTQVRAGANLLATISNDSWYGAAGAQAQHFAGAVLRSVENRRYLLRAAITGISGIVDEKGRILQELGENEEGIVRGRAALFGHRSVWTRWGFAFSGLCDALAAAALLLGLARWIKGRRPRLPPAVS
ncbi:MAG: apolipoprotein N-acyltransferase [Thermoanaerobaculia bacterium]|nr:apolipoprotein N-acyltransferase [Thermoanaerobaculia bacterium]